MSPMNWLGAGCSCNAREMLTASGSGVGSDYQRGPPAETVRDRPDAGLPRGRVVLGTDADGGVRRGLAKLAIGPGCC